MQKLLTKAWYLSLLLTLTTSAKADFADEYIQQEQVSWENAQYERSDKTLDGQALRVRTQVTKNGTMYSIQSNDKANVKRIGTLRDINSYSQNTCLFGYNLECASNIITTQVQYKIQGCNLFRYSREVSASGRPGEVSRFLEGSCRARPPK